MTTVTLPRRIVRPISAALSRRAVVIGFFGTIAAGLLLLAAISAVVALTTGDDAMPGVSVGGVSLAGLDRAEAEARLVAELPSLSTGEAVVTVGTAEYPIGYADLGRGYDMDAMLDAAFGVGRGDGLLADGIGRLRALALSTDLPVVPLHDAAALDAAATGIARSVSTYPVEATVTRDGTTFRLNRSLTGRVLDAADVAAALTAAVETADPADVRLSLVPLTTQPIVDTATASAAAFAAERMVGDLELTVPGSAEDEEVPILAAERIASMITFGPRGTESYAARVDATSLAAVAGELASEIDRDAIDARITVAAGGGLGGVVAALDGRRLEVDEAIASIGEALDTRARGATVLSLALPVTVTEPALTTAEAQAVLPQMRLVSSWTTRYVPNDGNGFGNNISIGAWDLDGYNIAPGEWFSFWGGIGPVTLDRGYRYGGAIINGRSVPNGALAGGICSTSTTLFNAAMRFGLEIGERENHYYYIDRYPTGLDATVAIVNDDVTDMTFRNDTDNPIVIRGFGTPGQVTFQLWSVPNGRNVVLGAPIISNRRAAIETTQLVPTMAPGTARRVEFPHSGFDASVTRTVYGPDGSIIHQNTWFSDYRAVNGITLVGPSLPAPPPPDDDGGGGGDDGGGGDEGDA